ncbi:MAG TPA: hypothetical protein VLM91_16335 [Candidatus Methylomirabilis sp.]|nr:hypothetical protein [Candidatus Methylomirabilis sp.]
MRKRMVALLLGVALVGQATASFAEGNASESTGVQIGTGVGSVVGSAVYFPFKASFCILGGVSSGFTYLFAGEKAAERVADTSCRGTWAISPNVVKGKETVHFAGTTR